MISIQVFTEGKYFCEHCGDMEGPHVVVESFEWCPDCAFANGDLTESEAEALWDGIL